jgi:imidazolonepropionase
LEVSHGPILIRGARQLLTLRGSKGPRRGADLDDVGIISDGALLIRDGLVAEAGLTRRVENLAAARGAKVIDAAGRVVMPGFVDSHTHLVYPPRADRADDRESAARAMRTWTAGWIEARTRPYLDAMVRHGTTTVEVKTGCGPDEAAEVKALKVIAALQGRPIDVVSTFLLRAPLGCSDEDVAQIVAEFPPRIERRGMAEFFDLWWDGEVSRQDVYARYLEGAAAFGLARKVHAEGPGCAVGLALAIGLRAMSIDHLEHITEDGLRLLGNARIVATVLPSMTFQGWGPIAPARRMLAEGAALALGTNFNPHNAATWNMQSVISLACKQMMLRPAEAVSAATINGAHALGRGDRIGSLEPGKVADVLLLNTDDYRDLGHYFGVNLVHMTIKKGVPIYREGDIAAPG